ncbi:hypothetical protein QXC78_004641 [Escherichia coli]|nr:hypothetical protein [Escherichia coli]ELD1720407.1 hypothetical protein [Escherichia coli]ELO1652551.1 hypothetical protein [Escherichia coli]ELO1653821.1 hypothetical protein [Escherichia coli]
MNIYIACALTHVPRELFTEYCNWIHYIAQALSPNHNVQYALLNSDPQLAAKPESNKSRLCYIWDREMVENAELVIAESSFPSTGLGIELQIAEHKNIPIILCYKDYVINRSKTVKYENPDHSSHQLQVGEGYISHMALGLPNVLETIFCEDIDKTCKKNNNISRCFES